MLKEYYNQVVSYLMATFDANFMLLTLFLTTAAAIVYFIIISYVITQMDSRYFVRNNLSHENIAHKNIAHKNSSADDTSETSRLTPINRSVSLMINIVKIMVGLFLLICGLVMLVLPGQGLLTMLMGLSLMPFPGKNKLEQAIISRKSVRYSLNWIRMKANKKPFIFY
ncbi:hypothetical protein H4J58_09275 [Colwellia sp. MB3u-70]|uniref:hypothetical protein n=1 Tax=unclassified Colwellia TaxID=196834 RepID=UPI0015F579C5|nr:MULTISPECIES: hypothetical protein [unclassified Colwellia]MBA6291282.1 hypothetical protein [Colwellia sp. MB3u-8]MBA6307302.1 hypothetical protein [Colwellia sp. MB3u-70]